MFFLFFLFHKMFGNTLEKKSKESDFHHFPGQLKITFHTRKVFSAPPQTENTFRVSLPHSLCTSISLFPSSFTHLSPPPLASLSSTSSLSLISLQNQTLSPPLFSSRLPLSPSSLLKKTLSTLSSLASSRLPLGPSSLLSTPSRHPLSNPAPSSPYFFFKPSTTPSRLSPPLASLSVPDPLLTKPSRLSPPSVPQSLCCSASRLPLQLTAINLRPSRKRFSGLCKTFASFAINRSEIKYSSGDAPSVLTPKELLAGMLGFLACKVAVVLAAFKPMKVDFEENE
uniref:Uncharacterized protein n=1 Tax=Salix viminalis TaxID=40686 RepID=A0A6N2MVQ2_SALVM